MNRQAYLDLFKDPAGTERQKQALVFAHDIRKFEIDLYWKRATYFWAFIAIAFAGFFASSNQADGSNTYVIACLGFVFSLAWYLVNRGSSAWQRNWEVHVDLLEDEISGPLHKVIVNRADFRFWDVLGPYSYSPSRLNTALSLLLVAVWVGLAGRTLVRIHVSGGGKTSMIIFSVLTMIAAAGMLWFARSGVSKNVPEIEADIREYD